MTPIQILTETRMQADEWLEMSQNPDLLVSGILANKLASAYETIEYLERRLSHECATR